MPKAATCSTSGAAGSSRTLDVKVENQGRQFRERAAKAAKRQEKVLNYVTGARKAVKNASEQSAPYAAPYAQYCGNLARGVEERMLTLIQTYHTLFTQPAVGNNIENSKIRARKKQTFKRGVRRLVASLDPYDGDISSQIVTMSRLEILEAQQKELGL